MRAIVFLLMAISCNELGFAQDYDDVFEHSAADTVSNSTDTMSMGHSKTLVFQTITLRDTNKSHDGLQYFQVIKISDPVGGRLVQEIADSGHSTHEIEFDDFNSDGYKDLMIHEDPDRMSPPSNVWLFNPQDGQFRFSKELSGMRELSVDYDGTITSQNLSTGGKGGEYWKYRFEHDSLVMVEDEYCNRFDYQKEVLVEGEMKTIELDRSDYRGDTETVTSKRIVFDSLRIVNKKIIEDAYGMDLTTVNKEAILDEPFGTYILLEEHEFEYKKTRRGKLAVHETIKKLVNNRFITTTDDFIEQ